MSGSRQSNSDAPDADARSAKILEQLRERERLEATIRLAGSVAHDMNNILGVIMSVTSLLREDVPKTHAWHEDLSSVLDVSERGRTLLRELLDHVSEHNLQKNRVRLNKSVAQVVGLLKRVIPANIELVLDIAPELPEVNGDALKLGQVVMNLCQNAVEAMREDGGRMAITLSTVMLATPSASSGIHRQRLFLRMVIEDTGIGMDEATRTRAFQPYFTTKQKPSGKLTRTDRIRLRGLGLTTVHKTVNSHSGNIQIESEPGAGTRVTVHLPAIRGPVTS
jgi:signal transduction histidine kinase